MRRSRRARRSPSRCGSAALHLRRSTERRAWGTASWPRPSWSRRRPGRPAGRTSTAVRCTHRRGWRRRRMQVAILVFERITALDAVGPHEVLSRLPDADVRSVAPEIGPKRTDEGSLVLLAEDRLDDVPAPDIVVVPGGVG